MATTFIATSLAIALPWVYFLRRNPLSWSTFVSILILVHTLTGLHTLLVRSPPNIFRALQVPLNTPTDAIRTLLLLGSNVKELNIEFEELIRRLASHDVRALYPRFGHNVLATCTYCQSFEDFAMYALPRPLISYIREIAFVGLITTSRRKAATTALFFIFVAEFYWLLTVDIKIPLRGDSQPGTFWVRVVQSYTRMYSVDDLIQWHDTLLNMRHIIFLILPLLIHFLPPFRLPFLSGPAPAPIVDSTPLLVQTHQTLAHLLPALHFLKYAQAAIMRVPDLRARTNAWWEEEARVGEWIRGDGADAKAGEEGATTSVRGVARGLELSFDEAIEGREEGKLRASAKVMTKVLIGDGLKPSEHWHQSS
ncbi:hypothetical protein H0H81_004815 [Sphagnurus paluster]|uniref:Uncharacterized protein n=1 Tax=Sphagnurus paluster TaxID=117069 RepID=A0A9P7GKW3_9AGAR|nr:hypothetical protein H0H81_004815 [Sphagnurus paluster]